MNATEILAEISANDCRACIEGENILLSGPRLLPRAIVNQIREHKAELLKMLASSDAGTIPPLTPGERADIDEAIDERAAIQEYDGGLPRPEAERQARAAMRVYRYRLDYNPGQWLIIIAPGCDLNEATRCCRNRFGAERVVEVRRRGYTP